MVVFYLQYLEFSAKSEAGKFVFSLAVWASEPGSGLRRVGKEDRQKFVSTAFASDQSALLPAGYEANLDFLSPPSCIWKKT